MLMRTRSRWRGFSRKSKAPSLVASTAAWMVPWPEIMMTSGTNGRVRSSARTSRPLRPGILMSSRTRSMPTVSRSVSSPSSPVPASKNS